MNEQTKWAFSMLLKKLNVQYALMKTSNYRTACGSVNVSGGHTVGHRSLAHRSPAVGLANEKQ